MITHILIGIVLLFLALLRIKSIQKESIEWNYKVYRFEKYAMLYNIDVDNCEANRVEGFGLLLVFLMVWKFRPRYFFSHTPNFKEIDELIYTGKI